MASSSKSKTIAILPTHNTLEESWNLLREGTDQMMTRPDKGMTYAKYMQLYTVFDMALCKDLNDQFKEQMAQTHDASDLSGKHCTDGLARTCTPRLTCGWLLGMVDSRFPCAGTGNGLLAIASAHDWADDPNRACPDVRAVLALLPEQKLTWLCQLLRMELKTNYTKTKYTFMVSSYQGAILLQFNVGGDSLAYSEISGGTGLDEATLKPNLALLVKQKVLTQDEDTYDLNLEFKSKKIRVSLNAPIKAEQKAESADVMKTVDKDQKMLIQALIVRKSTANNAHDRLMVLFVCNTQDNEISQDFEAPSPDPRIDWPARAALQAVGGRHQEGDPPLLQWHQLQISKLPPIYAVAGFGGDLQDHPVLYIPCVVSCFIAPKMYGNCTSTTKVREAVIEAHHGYKHGV
ncbi:hypothetical protein PTTG_07388 [Puccinia triticina 1-1 BBBD Race 1]|uniref:CULLIN_2 domain-containing protein n=1 Tax=Puccinia triticina (isolate 1-1 / race 1 (BBBD)) TaxID=630390 RepID=A0A180GQT5_PUCT1|nr:hypothetical protein PTTG_07388 [Puccinia triticina 1-1 BBBD Race 1]